MPRNDLSGAKFGKLTVVKYIGRSKYECICDCGNTTIVKTGDLNGNKTKSCGCLKNADLTGEKFGHITILSLTNDRTKQGRRVWQCKCDCGKIFLSDTKSIMDNKSQSCGCLRNVNIIKSATKHGMSNSRLYKIWAEMKNRCTDQNTAAYQYYGKRGIKVCDDWLDGFEKFYNWAIQNGYNDKLTIDRIDVNGNYEPSNCRWATQKEQANNKRTSRKIAYNNEVHTISEWSEITGLNKTLIRERLNRGWSVNDALCKVPDNRHND